ERTEGTDRAHAHPRRVLGRDVPAVHRVAVAIGADDRRGGRDGGGRGLLRSRVGPAREPPRASDVRRPGRAVYRPLPRCPHTAPLPCPATHHRGTTTSKG